MVELSLVIITGIIHCLGNLRYFNSNI